MNYLLLSQLGGTGASVNRMNKSFNSRDELTKGQSRSFVIALCDRPHFLATWYYQSHTGWQCAVRKIQTYMPQLCKYSALLTKDCSLNADTTLTRSHDVCGCFDDCRIYRPVRVCLCSRFYVDAEQRLIKMVSEIISWNPNQWRQPWKPRLKLRYNVTSPYVSRLDRWVLFPMMVILFGLGLH